MRARLLAHVALCLAVPLLMGSAPPPKSPPKPPPSKGNNAGKAAAKAAAHNAHVAKIRAHRRAAHMRWLFWHTHYHLGVGAPGHRVRTFANRSQAGAFVSRLSRYHFIHHMHANPNGSVTVSYGSHHWHRVLSTHYIGVATSHAARLQALGFATRITRHVY